MFFAAPFQLESRLTRLRPGGRPRPVIIPGPDLTLKVKQGEVQVIRVIGLSRNLRGHAVQAGDSELEGRGTRADTAGVLHGTCHSSHSTGHLERGTAHDLAVVLPDSSLPVALSPGRNRMY